MREVSLLDLRQAGQLDAVGRVGGKVLSFDCEFEDRTHKLVVSMLRGLGIRLDPSIDAGAREAGDMRGEPQFE